MVVGAVFTVPITAGITAARVAFKQYQKGTLKRKVGERLEDGSTLLCCTDVEVARAYKSLGFVPAPHRNAFASAREHVRGLDERVFMALRTKEGETILLLLTMPKEPTDNGEEAEVTLITPKNAERPGSGTHAKNIDSSFSEGMGWMVPKLEDTAFIKLKEGVYRLQPRRTTRMQSYEMYDLRLLDASAICWFDGQVARTNGHAESNPLQPEAHAKHGSARSELAANGVQDGAPAIPSAA